MCIEFEFLILITLLYLKFSKIHHGLMYSYIKKFIVFLQSHWLKKCSIYLKI